MTAIRDENLGEDLPTAADVEPTERAQRISHSGPLRVSRSVPPQVSQSGAPRVSSSNAPLEHALVTHHVHRSFAMATYGPLFIAVVNGAVRGERVQAIIDEARLHCERHPDGGCFSLVVGPDTGLPDAGVRGLMSAAIDELGGYIQAAAVIIDRDGFSAATARSVVSTMFFATGRRLTMRVFKSVRSAATWQAIAIHHEPRLRAERIAEAIERVRRQQQTHRSSARP